MATPVAVLGASGFTGGELVRLLLGHGHVEIGFVGADSSAGGRLADVHPQLASTSGRDLVLEPHDPRLVTGRVEIAFLALPAGASARIAPDLLDAGVRVVDLGGDHRLPADAYPYWYGFELPAPAWLDKAVYGLPEVFAEQIAGADLVANPGCFPTAALTVLVPLVRAGLIEPRPILIDGKTGWSGAGRAVGEDGSWVRAEESVRPYRAPRHQHTPEIELVIERATGRGAGVAFVPHLVPASRGLLVTCYAPLAGATSTEDLTAALEAAYVAAPFVRVLPPGAMADTKRTRGSNVVEVQAIADERTGHAIAIAALDNLVKGAAGQAVQNLNLMLGLQQSTGLPAAGVYP